MSDQGLFLSKRIFRQRQFRARFLGRSKHRNSRGECELRSELLSASKAAQSQKSTMIFLPKLAPWTTSSTSSPFETPETHSLFLPNVWTLWRDWPRQICCGFSSRNLYRRRQLLRPVRQLRATAAGCLAGRGWAGCHTETNPVSAMEFHHFYKF